MYIENYCSQENTIKKFMFVWGWANKGSLKSGLFKCVISIEIRERNNVLGYQAWYFSSFLLSLNYFLIWFVNWFQHESTQFYQNQLKNDLKNFCWYIVCYLIQLFCTHFSDEYVNIFFSEKYFYFNKIKWNLYLIIN